MNRLGGAAGRGEERGAVAILVALLTVVLVASMAIVSDLGYAYGNQRRLQTGVDAAALAVGRRMAAAAGPTDTCASLRTAYNTATTRATASSVFSKNANPAAALSSGSAGFEVTCETVGSNSETLVVKVSGQQNSPTFFGGFLGRSNVPVTESARVIVGPLGTAVGLRPFAICRVTAEQVQNSPGTTFIVPIDNDDHGCGSAAGNWAMLDFDAGNNANGDLAGWVANGYDGPISNSPPVLIPGDPGFNVNSMQTEMNTMMAQSSIVLPVYSSVSGSGQNSSFTITGFLSVVPCRYKINSKSGPAVPNAACGPLPANPPSDYIQLVFSSFIPVGSLNINCRLNDNSCDNGPRTAVLAD